MFHQYSLFFSHSGLNLLVRWSSAHVQWAQVSPALFDFHNHWLFIIMFLIFLFIGFLCMWRYHDCTALYHVFYIIIHYRSISILSTWNEKSFKGVIDLLYQPPHSQACWDGQTYARSLQSNASTIYSQLDFEVCRVCCWNSIIPQRERDTASAQQIWSHHNPLILHL